VCVCHNSFICVTPLVLMCDTTHLYVRHNSFICGIWLIHMCDMTHPHGSSNPVCVCHNSMCAMTHSLTHPHGSSNPVGVCHNSMCAITLCAMTYSFKTVHQDALTFHVWYDIIAMCDMTQSIVIRVTCIIIALCDMPQSIMISVTCLSQ